MVIADWIFIAGILVFAGLGAFLGFGKQLELLTKGVFGIIVSVIICYFVFGLVYNIPIVQNLLLKFKEALAATEKPFVNFLFKIRIDIIAYAVVLFLVVSALRLVIVYILKNVMEVDSKPIRIANKTLGVILGIAVFISIGLIVMQIVFFASDGAVPEPLQGSLFRLDRLYEHNPLAAQIIKWLKSAVEAVPAAAA